MIRIARLTTSAPAAAAAAAAATIPSSPRAALAAARRAPRASALASTSATAAPSSSTSTSSPTPASTTATASAAKRVRAARTPRAAAPSAAASAASTPPPPPPQESADDLDLFLPTEGIEDYAHLRPQAYPSSSSSPSTARSSARSSASAPARRARAAPTPTPTPSPPLTALPDAGYDPLPTADASTYESGGAPGPPGSSPWSPSHPGELGAKTLEDGYAFSRMPGEQAVEDWTTSFKGLSVAPFPKEVAEALLRPLEMGDVEMKPDGLLYLPEIKYRRTLNMAFGPGGWGLAPRGETHIGPRIVSREWGLVCLGRLVAIARGEQEYFDPSGIPTATEACKSNALMRCCKDLGIASELWDPRFIREFKAKYCVEAMVEHVTQKKRRKLWRKKDQKFEYPYKEIGPVNK